MNHFISLGIILLVAFLVACLFVGMALFSTIPNDEVDDFDITVYPDDEDNVMFGGRN